VSEAATLIERGTADAESNAGALFTNTLGISKTTPAPLRLHGLGCQWVICVRALGRAFQAGRKMFIVFPSCSKVRAIVVYHTFDMCES